MQNSFLLAVLAAIAVALVVAIALVVPRAPVPVAQGTAPSVVTRSAGAEAEPLGAASDARERAASGNSARAPRGSGIEGVTSAGTTHGPAVAQ
jgi:hypothetical protein